MLLKTPFIFKCLLACIYTSLILSSYSAQANSNTLNVSVPSFAPFNSFAENAQCHGASVMALKHITRHLDIELRFIDYPYARILHSLKSAELDVALIFKNSHINNDVDYIGPVSHSKIVIISKPQLKIEKYTDLHVLKSVAVIRNAQFDDKFDNDHLINKVNVDSYQQAARMLKHNRVDAMIGSLIGIEYALHQQGMSKSMLENAFNLGKKEWGLHFAKKSRFSKLKPLLAEAVKQNYQENLIHHLYQQQVENCL